MSSIGRPVKAPSPGDNAFPQADSLVKLIDVAVAAAHTPHVDEASLAETFGVTSRQGSYYASAAMHVGLVYKRGGYIKPTPAGQKICAMTDEQDRRTAVAVLVLELPVFREAAQHAVTYGKPPPLEELAAWVRAEDAKVNDVTAGRRAQTVVAWVNSIMEHTPDALEPIRAAMAPAPGMRAA